MKSFTTIFGVVLVLFSFYMAWGTHSIHSYEITLLGLAFVLLSQLPKKMMDKKTAVRLYFAFVIAGFVVDFLVGLSITQVWYYTYTSWIEYVLLYLYIYPAGGFVMVWSYLLGLHWLRLDTTTASVSRPLLILGAVVFGVLGVMILMMTDIIPLHWPILFFWSSLIAGIFLVMWLSELRHRESYARDIIATPFRILFVTLVATYLNALIHELPNVAAPAWVYVIHTNTFLDAFFLGVPYMVWAGWLLLLIGPVSLLYVVKSRTTPTSLADGHD